MKMAEGNQQTEEYFLRLWVLANVIGWSFGLLLGLIASLALGWFGVSDFFAFTSGGILTGAFIGRVQRFALRRGTYWHVQHWVMLSILGSILGTWIVWVGMKIVEQGDLVPDGTRDGWLVFSGIAGIVFAASIATTQGFVLRQLISPHIWVLACMGGGAICGVLSSPGTPIHSVITWLWGPALFGLITGSAFKRLKTSAATSDPSPTNVLEFRSNK